MGEIAQIGSFCEHEGFRVVVEATACGCPEGGIFVTRGGPMGERVNFPFSACETCLRNPANYCANCDQPVRYALSAANEGERP